jgi:hypothetical protein
MLRYIKTLIYLFYFFTEYQYIVIHAFRSPISLYSQSSCLLEYLLVCVYPLILKSIILFRFGWASLTVFIRYFMYVFSVVFPMLPEGNGIHLTLLDLTWLVMQLH